MPNSSIEEAGNVDAELDSIFESREHMRKELSRLCHGNLYVIGRLWIEALRSVLVGASFSLFPILKAAKKDNHPEKPPSMRYKDLPIYESPHYEYKDYIENQNKCSNLDVKLLQQYLFPKVSIYKKSWVDFITEFNKNAGELKDDIFKETCKKKEQFVSYLRHPDNYSTRQAVVILGAAVGFKAALRSRSILKKILFTSLGALAAGSLCFPEKTDEIFRDLSLRFGNALYIFDCVGEKRWLLRKRVPCYDDMPAIPGDRPATENNKCEKMK